MKRSSSVLLAMGIVASSSFAYHVASAGGNSVDTSCWDQYNLRGTTKVSTLVPSGVAPKDCTPAPGCWFGYRASDGKRNSWYVPYGMKPSQACLSTSTAAPETTAAAAPETTAAPAPETTAAPAPETTAAPAPETTAAPAPETTAAPAPETTAAPAPDTTAAPAPDTTAAPAPDTTAAPAPTTALAGQFVETFTGNTGLDRFNFGVYHRGDALGGPRWPGATSWPGDHDLNCGPPTEGTRTVRRDTDEWIYLCRDHIMTSIGDTDGYSTGWFAPKQTFTTQRTVSWDVNVTDLLGRQWWEVSIVPANFNSGIPSCPQCSAMSWIADTAGLPAYPAGSVVVGNSQRGFQVWTDGVDRQVMPHWLIRYDDPEGAASKAIRRPFSMTDNANGTITVNYGGLRTFTVPGTFPDEFVVVFKDHNYTPDKDGIPVGYTWHWDNIIIR
jgi:hypothetical protein